MDPSRSSPATFCRDWHGALALFVVVVAVFWPATGYDFINYDDPPFVQENPFVNTGLSWANLRWAFTAVCEQWWLPVLWISFMIDAALYGPGPFGFHLTNILLHAVNAALLFWILWRLTGFRGQSLFVAAAFALHPLRVESVVWITARKDVLSGLFFMLALLAFLWHARRPSPWRMASVALLMLLGLMSKAILIILPPILLLLDYWPLRRAGNPLDRKEWKDWGNLLREKWMLILLAAIFIGINLTTHTTGRGDTAGLSWTNRLALIPPNYWTYVGKLLWPHPLSIIYPQREGIAPWLTVFSLLGLVTTTVVLYRLRNRLPALIVGWLWFLIALSPSIRGLRMGIGDYADRFTYLPSIGFFLMVAIAANHLFRNRRQRNTTLALLATVMLAAGAVKTRALLPIWKDSVSLFEYVRARFPDDPIAYCKLAEHHVQSGHLDEAERLLLEALRLHPEHLRAHLQLANLYAASHRRQQAIDQFRLVPESSPVFPFAANNIAWLLATHPEATSEDLNEALRVAELARQASPAPAAQMFDTLGAVYAANGRFEEAIAAAKEARRLALENKFTNLAERIARRLSGYESGRAWVE